MSKKSLFEFWKDGAGAIVSGEIALIATVAVTGVMAGMVAMRDAVNSELADLAGAYSSLDQSYAFSGQARRVGNTTMAWTSGSQWTDIVGVSGEILTEVAPEQEVPAVPQVEESAADKSVDADQDRPQRRRRVESARRREKEGREQGDAGSDRSDAAPGQGRAESAQTAEIVKAAGSWQTTTMPMPGHKRAIVREVRHIIPASASDVVAVYPDCDPCRSCLPCGGCALPGCRQCVALVQVPHRSVDRSWPVTREVCTGVHGVRVSDTLLSPRPCPEQIVDAAIYWGHLQPKDLKQRVVWSGHPIQNVVYHSAAEYPLLSPGHVVVPQPPVPAQHHHVVPQQVIPAHPVHEHPVPHQPPHPAPATLVPLQPNAAVVPAVPHQHAVHAAPAVPVVPAVPGIPSGNAVVPPVPAAAPAVQIIPGTTGIIREHAPSGISVIPAARRRIPSVDHYYVAPPNQHQPRFPESVWNQ